MAFRFYEPTVQLGGMLVYEGSRRQRGGNVIVDSLRRIGAPLGRLFARKAVKVGKDLGKRGLRAGVGALTDRLRGGPSVTMKEALKNRAIGAADKAMVDYFGNPDKPDIPFVSQDGMGLLPRRRKRKQRGRGLSKASKSINKIKRGKKKKSKGKQRRRDIYSSSSR